MNIQDLKEIILSIEQLDHLGCKVHIKDEILKMMRYNLVLMKAKYYEKSTCFS